MSQGVAVEWRGLRYDWVNQSISNNGSLLPYLMPIRKKILGVLLSHKGRFVPMSLLISHLQPPKNRKTLDQHIFHIREWLLEVELPFIIVNQHGKGFFLVHHNPD